MTRPDIKTLLKNIYKDKVFSAVAAVVLFSLFVGIYIRWVHRQHSESLDLDKRSTINFCNFVEQFSFRSFILGFFIFVSYVSGCVITISLLNHQQSVSKILQYSKQWLGYKQTVCVFHSQRVSLLLLLFSIGFFVLAGRVEKSVRLWYLRREKMLPTSEYSVLEGIIRRSRTRWSCRSCKWRGALGTFQLSLFAKTLLFFAVLHTNIDQLCRKLVLVVVERRRFCASVKTESTRSYMSTDHQIERNQRTRIAYQQIASMRLLALWDNKKAPGRRRFARQAGKNYSPQRSYRSFGCVEQTNGDRLSAIGVDVSNSTTFE